jgi:hypothetical protein
MKKVILKESQIKYIIDNLINNTISEQWIGDKKSERESRRAAKKQKLSGPSDWDNKDEGSFNFLSTPGAFNVGEKGYAIAHHVSAAKLGKAMPGKETPPKETPGKKPEPTLSTFTVQGSSLPYADNMVKPYFNKYPDALETFNQILQKFVDYIKNGGGPNLTNVTIKGSADSAKPTTDVPAGYTKLDHPHSKAYNGLTDPKERNQYLADTRASEYAKVLSAKVKELTGFDLIIKVLPGDNYYGQEGKRGIEYRSIVLTPNAGELKKTEEPSEPEVKPAVTPGKSEPGGKVKIPSIPYKVGIYTDEEGYWVNGYNVTEATTGYNYLGVSYEDAQSLGIPLFKEVEESKIVGDKLYVGGKLVGKIDTMNNAPENFNYMGGKKPQYFAGPISRIVGTRDNEIEGQGKVTVAYVDNIYFLFY